jgi:hypothetical protein
VSLKSDMQEGVVEVSWRRQQRGYGDLLVWLWSGFCAILDRSYILIDPIEEMGLSQQSKEI